MINSHKAKRYESGDLPSYAIFHAGLPDQTELRANPKNIWGRVSNHVYFLADENKARREYLKGDDVIYVIDGLYAPHGTVIVTNNEALWYDRIVEFEGTLAIMEQRGLSDVFATLTDEPSDVILAARFRKHGIATKQDVEAGLSEAKKEWFRNYTRPFNINRFESYRKRGSVIMVPGPIQVK